ncbi:MAG: alkaline phosphatase family protein [Candidatus Nanohaloarchaea archaeon]
MILIGVDAATWDIIKPHRDELPNFSRLMEECDHKTLTVDEKPKSAPVWTSIFTGLSQEEHGHRDFIVDDELQKRPDIDAEFVWERIDDEKVDQRILQVPAVYPQLNHRVDYEPVGYGVTSDLDELDEDMEKLREKSLEVLEEGPDFFAVVFMQLDKVSHFYWDDEELVLEWYKKMDDVLGDLLEYYDFDSDEPLIVLSDHGFAEHGEGRVQTLPEETPAGELKGDHHEDAVLITKNVDYDIEDPEDVGRFVLQHYSDSLKDTT